MERSYYSNLSKNLDSSMIFLCLKRHRKDKIRFFRALIKLLSLDVSESLRKRVEKLFYEEVKNLPTLIFKGDINEIALQVKKG